MDMIGFFRPKIEDDREVHELVLCKYETTSGDVLKLSHNFYSADHKKCISFYIVDETASSKNKKPKDEKESYALGGLKQYKTVCGKTLSVSHVLYDVEKETHIVFYAQDNFSFDEI
jgi:hypothetical protein